MEKTEENKISPMMQQWHACKKKAGDAVLFFRMGDFYEAFYEDAQLLAKELDLTLTRRQDIPMSGVPHHTSEGYIDKLVAKGYRVAVAEQIEDPKTTKGIVKREVVRLVTPGTIINSSLLSEKNNNFFASLAKAGQLYGLAFIDLTTGGFVVAEFTNERDLLNELYRLQPAEYLTSEKFKNKHSHLFDELQQSYPFIVNTEADWHFEHQSAYEFLVQHFKVYNLDGFGLQGMAAAINAAGALLHHFQNSLCLPIQHILDIRPYTTAEFMLLDRMTQANLELTRSLQDGSRRNTLLGVIDHTLTPMGARLLHQWIKQPLLNLEEIRQRQQGVLALTRQPSHFDRLKTLLIHVKDLERLMMKISTGFASPRDIAALHYSFLPVEEIKNLLLQFPSQWITFQAEQLDPLPAMNQLIGQALVEAPPLRLGDGKTFKEGYNLELDELRAIAQDSKAWMANYQNTLREQTGIKTLKVGYTKMFGYYIEVSRGQAEKMPDTFMRRQTLVNAERFITPELKNFETKVLTAEEKIASIESELFYELRHAIAFYTKRVLEIAAALAKLDALISLAETANRHGYTCPEIDTSSLLDIEGGRHPVIETVCMNEKFVPNHTYLDDQNERMLVITGPNMAGKSTYMRQVALIVILAQMGSFVPAKRARIGLIDKVFTRIGASDDLSRGQSTFMVEMSETASILNNTTSRSLVILDEIGRGTSTYDGISIAWSV
ncbi:MAG: DNA mismatch repair protein MutS, partial [Parachlamydia sp.]|nr:DNA mismatch repair protein MutS [Parachlamydia sp.]